MEYSTRILVYRSEDVRKFEFEPWKRICPDAPKLLTSLSYNGLLQNPCLYILSSLWWISKFIMAFGCYEDYRWSTYEYGIHSRSWNELAHVSEREPLKRSSKHCQRFWPFIDWDRRFPDYSSSTTPHIGRIHLSTGYALQYHFPEKSLNSNSPR